MKREPIVSPVPLPPGVICIDPTDDSTASYFPDFVRHLRQRENLWMHSVNQILGDHQTSLSGNRSLLMSWLLEVALHFRVSQETLYHTVGIVDAVLARRQVDAGFLQLVGITAFLIANKLEEYHPPSVRDLLSITDNSYKYEEVLTMERKLLKVLDFHAYNAEPMVFIQRFVRAALRDGDKEFLHAALLFYDALIPSVEYSSFRASEKAAAAVYAALIILPADLDEANGMGWTPTLEVINLLAAFNYVVLRRMRAER